MSITPCPRTAAILLAFACSLLLAGRADAALLQARRASFERQSDSGPRGVVELAFDEHDYAELARQHAQGSAFELSGLPFPGGLDARLLLRPVGAMAAGARAQVIEPDGSVLWLAPSVCCFSGSIEGGGEAFLGITASELHGYFRLGRELYFLSSGGAPRGRATLAHAAALGTGASAAAADFCALAGAPQPAQVPGPSGARALGAPVLKTADVFIEADNAYRALFASDQACIDYSTLLITAASEVYRRDIGARLQLPNGYLRVWNTTPPWGVITSFNGINAVRNYWVSFNNPDRSLARAAVHVLTTPVFGGVAYNIGGLCRNTQGYEVSSVFGHFPYPVDHTNNDNWDLFVLTHEFGHSFGCVHSFDFAPPIDCQDGSGPDQGTIMSYCHLSFGTGAVGMRFHIREQVLIRDTLSTTVNCLASQPLQPGDYDADGQRDLDDLVAANAILGQGFRSLGAEETLDMDGDGDFDALDRDGLAAAIGAAPASATVRNGTGLNPECLLAMNNPVLGTTWTPAILAPGLGRVTALFLFDLPHPGLPTGYGELLVLPPGLGGSQLLSRTALSSGVLASYSLAIPFDVALIGMSAVAQGIVVGPPGTQLCNALDLVLSPFE